MIIVEKKTTLLIYNPRAGKSLGRPKPKEILGKMWEAHTMAKDEDVDAFDPRRKEETANA